MVKAIKTRPPLTGRHKEVLNKQRQQDEAAFDRIFDELFPIVYNAILIILKDRELAQEVVTKVFCSVWEARNFQKKYVYELVTRYASDAFLEAIRREKKKMMQNETHSAHCKSGDSPPRS